MLRNRNDPEMQQRMKETDQQLRQREAEVVAEIKAQEKGTDTPAKNYERAQVRVLLLLIGDSLSKIGYIPYSSGPSSR